MSNIVNTRKYAAITFFSFFSTFFQLKGKVGFYKSFKMRHKSWYTFCPFQVGLSKLLSQELFLGKHDPLIVQPVDQAKNKDKPQMSCKQCWSQPQKEVADIQGDASPENSSQWYSNGLQPVFLHFRRKCSWVCGPWYRSG